MKYNNAPVVTTSGGNTTYTEGTPVVVDANIVVTDADNTNLTAATISINIGFQASEDALQFTNQNGITGSYDATIGTLSLTGLATVANYQAALRSVKYSNSSSNPNTLTRYIFFAVNDGTANSNPAIKTITVTAVNNAPVVTTSGGSTAYTEGTTAVVDANIVVTDADNTNLTAATIRIATGFQPGEDALQFTTQNGITGTYNATNGTLSLTGSSTVANYQTALRSIKYDNNSSTPNTANRTISFVINDGTANSNTAVKTVTVTAVNNAPTLDAISNVTIPQTAPAQAVSLTGITDGGDGGQTLTVTATSNNTALIPNPTVTYSSPNTTGSLSFTPVTCASGTATITVTVTDNGSTTNGGLNTFSRTFVVTVNAAATPTVTITQPTCPVPTGTITVNTPTGTGITYSIDNTNYQTSNVFNNVASGNYNVTAKNSSGCVSAPLSVTINTQPGAPATPTVTVVHPPCTVATGTITVNTPTGAGITYSIDNTNYQASNIFNNVVPGNYNVTAKNSAGCTSAATPVTINSQPASPAMPTVTVVQPSCTIATGTITVNTPTGSGITYSIDGTIYQSSNVFSNVAPGNYNVTAKNSSGCVSSATPVTINAQPATPATPTVTVTQPTCSFATGSITVNSPSGTGITYSIDGTTYQASNIFNNVAPGTHNVTAKNGSGCVSAAFPVTINAAPGNPATPTLTVVQPTCSVATGTITVNSPSGSGITYSIDGTNYQSSNGFTNVAPGNYNVTAKNSAGCLSAPLALTINAAPTAPATPTATATQPSCTVATGTITVNTPTGAGITYSIDGTTYQSGTTFSGVAPGNYNVTAKNSSGCVSAATPLTINTQPATPATPTVTIVQPTCSVSTGTVTVNTPIGSGTTYSIDGTNYQAGNVFTNVAPGNYNLTAKNSSGCVSASTPVTINAAPGVPATPTVSVTQPTCTVATGTISVNTPTGTGITYSIDGTNYQVSNIFNNLAPGNYNVTAKNTTSSCVSAATPVTVNTPPSAGSCTALTRLYVNDNDLTGDHYTTAVGNDATGDGTPARPYRTISKAVSVAAAGNTIFVDAGTYNEGVTVNKTLTLRDCLKLFYILMCKWVYAIIIKV